MLALALVSLLAGCLKVGDAVIVDETGAPPDPNRTCEDTEHFGRFERLDARFEPSFAGCAAAGGPCTHALSDVVVLTAGESLRATWTSLPITWSRCDEDGVQSAGPCEYCAQFQQCRFPGEDAVITPVFASEVRVRVLEVEGQMDTNPAVIQENDPFSGCPSAPSRSPAPPFTPDKDATFLLLRPGSFHLEDIPLPQLMQDMLMRVSAAVEVKLVPAGGREVFSLPLELLPKPATDPDPNLVRYVTPDPLFSGKWEVNFSNLLRATRVRVKDAQGTALAPYRLAAYPEGLASTIPNTVSADDLQCAASPNPPPDVPDDGVLDLQRECFHQTQGGPLGSFVTVNATPTYRTDVAGAEQSRILWLVEFITPPGPGPNDNDPRDPDRRFQPPADDNLTLEFEVIPAADVGPAPNRRPLGFVALAQDPADSDTTVPTGGDLRVAGWAADRESGAPVAVRPGQRHTAHRQQQPGPGAAQQPQALVP